MIMTIMLLIFLLIILVILIILIQDKQETKGGVEMTYKYGRWCDNGCGKKVLICGKVSLNPIINLYKCSECGQEYLKKNKKILIKYEGKRCKQ